MAFLQVKTEARLRYFWDELSSEDCYGFRDDIVLCSARPELEDIPEEATQRACNISAADRVQQTTCSRQRAAENMQNMQQTTCNKQQSSRRRSRAARARAHLRSCSRPELVLCVPSRAPMITLNTLSALSRVLLLAASAS